MNTNTSQASTSTEQADTVGDADAHAERKRAYCAKLCKTIARYSSAKELDQLAQHLDAFKAQIIASRYAPGLNDAAYDLYVAFHLRPATRQHADQAQES